MAEAPTARKVQLSIPVVDSSVIEWLDLQYSASESIRRLIRESVAREGFVDVANRPVRPPAHPVYVAESLPDDEDEEPAPKTPAPKASTPKASTPAAKPPVAAETAPEAPAPANADATATIDDLLGL